MIRWLNCLLLVAFCMLPCAVSAQDSTSTATDPRIATGILELQVIPLTQKELETEAENWRALVQAKAQEIAATEVLLRGLDQPVEGEPDPAAVAELTQQKATLLETLTTLRGERTALIDRLRIVLKALEAKGGDIAGLEQYVHAVSGIQVDVTDTDALWTTAVGWLRSEEGGIRVGLNALQFFVIIISAMFLSAVLGNVARRMTTRSKRVSDLLGSFITKSVRRVVFVAGLFMGIAALEIDIGPVLALIGAAGFVVAFALQGTLSNFASGLMILLYRPFDASDLVELSGVLGTVRSTSLVSTHIRTPDNKAIIIPNNMVWGGVITNHTGSGTRRVDMVFGIGYEDDIEKAQGILQKIARDHEKTLDDPEPVVQLHELGDSSVNFVCRPWVKSEDYWEVYWDITRTVKKEFDANGVSIPFPQRDVHVHQVTEPAPA